MTRDEFDHRWTAALGVTEAALLRDGVLHPAFLVVGRDGRGGPVAADLATHGAREDTYVRLRLACVAADAVLVAYMGEAEAAAGDVLAGGEGPAGVPDEPPGDPARCGRAGHGPARPFPSSEWERR